MLVCLRVRRGALMRKAGEHIPPIEQASILDRVRQLRAGGVTWKEAAAALDISVFFLYKNLTDSADEKPLSPALEAELGRLADFVEFDAPPVGANELTERDMSDIRYAVRDATGNDVEFDQRGHPRLRFAASDDAMWYDEEEPPMPMIPRRGYFSHLAAAAKANALYLQSGKRRTDQGWLAPSPSANTMTEVD